MIDLKRTTSDWEIEKPLSSTAEFAEEGMLVTSSLVDGSEVVAPTTGAGTDKVLGFSKGDTILPADYVYTESSVVPASATLGVYGITLGHNNITADDSADGDIAVYDDTASAWLTRVAVGAPASGEFSVVSAAAGTIRFHADEKEHDVTIYARVEYTARERDQKIQRRHINSGSLADLSKIGVISGTGQMYTDQYDVGVGDWTTGTLRAGTNGRITTAGAGKSLATAMRVIKVPTSDDAFLGLEFTLPMSS